MSTTDLAQCSKCAALLNDTDEDIAKHRRWHAQFETDFETIRRVASTASRDVATLTATTRDLARPVTAPEPAQVHIRVTDDEELEPDADELAELTHDESDDQPVSTYVDDQVQDTVALDPADYPAIDRPDDDPTGNTGSYNLYRS